eukprot:COSAG02_NODE_48421_length_334_cov_0.442553_1_plen_29_part_10
MNEQQRTGLTKTRKHRSDLTIEFDLERDK